MALPQATPAMSEAAQAARELAEVEPLTLAAWLAVLGGDMPGFDNTDRTNLRRIARALAGGVAPAELRTMCRHALIRHDMNRLAWTRPEAVLLAAVHFLAVRLPAPSDASVPAASPPSGT